MLKVNPLNTKLYYLEFLNKSTDYSEMKEYSLLKYIADDILKFGIKPDGINPRYYENELIKLLKCYKNINSAKIADKNIYNKIEYLEMIISLMKLNKTNNTDVSIKVFTHYIDHNIFDNDGNNIFIYGFHTGGLCIVSEIGRELIIYPNRRRVNLSGNNGSELIYLPMNSEVISNKDTEVILEGKTVKYLIDGTIDVIKTFGSITEFNIRYNNVFGN